MPLEFANPPTSLKNILGPLQHCINAATYKLWFQPVPSALTPPTPLFSLLFRTSG